MDVSLKADPKKKYVAYGIFWGKSCGKFQRLHCVIDLNTTLNGFTILSESEIDIVGPSLDNYLLVEHGNGVQSLIHKAAYPFPEFYEDLVNSIDPQRVEQLFQNMRDMNLEPNYI